MPDKIIIKQIKSKISTSPKQRATLRALGLRRVNSERIHENNPVIMGMIDKVRHLVDVRPVKN